MEKIRLKIPFAVPLMGESFVEVGAPVLTAALDFSWLVTIEKGTSGKLEIPIRSPQLNGVLASFLSSQGLEGSYSVSGLHVGGPDQDFVNTVALLYMTDCEAIGAELPTLLEDASAGTFLTAMRAMTSLSGGLVVGRRDEGFLSVDTPLRCPFCVRTLETLHPHGEAVKRFSRSFPGLSNALWHFVSHLVLKGIDAAQAGDLEAFASAISLETSILYSIGSLSLSDLQRLSSFASRGRKVVLLPGWNADVIIPTDHDCPNGFQRMAISMEGVNEIEE